MVTKRNGAWFIYFYPFRGGKKVGLKLPAVKGKKEAEAVEAAILQACRIGNFTMLDSTSREACIRMFENQKWQLPEEFDGERTPKAQLTLWRASELFCKYPEIKASPGKWRHEFSLIHLVEKLGKDTSIKSIWIPEIKQYQIERLNDEAAPDTVNRELSTLSRIFNVLIEMKLIESNPVRLVKRLSTKSGERQAYIAQPDVLLIVNQCPEWFRPMILTAYYTGMRRGEILGLTRKQVNLKKRMITLTPDDTKEAHWKRVPIHRDLVPVLEGALRVRCFGADKAFLLVEGEVVRPLGLETFKNPWPRACEALEKAESLKKPFPRFHDLRHTWKTNARRSGMDPEIREAILGHTERGKSVVERYGRISDQELLNAIDSMSFSHGDTEILVSNRRREAAHEK